jgi:phosphate starvation-inducible protein PhoH
VFVENLSTPQLILLCGGPAGSGKTYLSCGYAVNSFRAGVANKIIMTRPTITVENEYGFFCRGRWR